MSRTSRHTATTRQSPTPRAGRGNGVVRAWAIARTRATGESLPDTDTTPLAIAGPIVLWLLRLVLAPGSTMAGFRRWVIAECPAAPRTRPAATPAPLASPPARHTTPRPNAANGKPHKQDLLIALAGQRHDLVTVPLHQVAAIATTIGSDIGLHPGTARRVLRAHVRTLQQHHAAASPEETANRTMTLRGVHHAAQTARRPETRQ